MRKIYIKYLWLTIVFALVMALSVSGKTKPHTKRVKPELSVLSVVINIPAFRLTLYENGEVVKSYPIAVGMSKYKTPSSRTWLIRRIEWNPWWYPPKSAWARRSRNTPPGPKNPLGPVKIILGSGILVHGTPNESSIGRTASHGCIRLHPDDARELAWTLTAYGGSSNPGFNIAMADENPTSTYKVRLMHPVKFKLVYNTVEVRKGKVFIHRDVYRKSRPDVKKLKRALSDYGYDLDDTSLDEIKGLFNNKAPFEVDVEELLGPQYEPRT